jgi:hypothetical protein
LKTKHWIAFALAATLFQGAQAQVYAGLEASATRLSEPAWRGRGAGLILGWVANDHLAFELGWRRLGNDLVVDQPQAGSLWEATGLWRYQLSDAVNAYARVGAAQVRGELADAVRNGDRLRPLLGLGLHVLVAKDWALRAEAQRVGSGLTGLRLGVVRRF